MKLSTVSSENEFNNWLVPPHIVTTKNILTEIIINLKKNKIKAIKNNQNLIKAIVFFNQK